MLWTTFLVSESASVDVGRDMVESRFAPFYFRSGRPQVAQRDAIVLLIIKLSVVLCNVIGKKYILSLVSVLLLGSLGLSDIQNLVYLDSEKEIEKRELEEELRERIESENKSAKYVFHVSGILL